MSETRIDSWGVHAIWDGLRQVKLLAPFFKLARLLEVDRAIYYGIVLRSWTFLAGPATIILITMYFSPETQGFYYTFTNLLYLKILVDLGLSTVIVQFTSHEWANLDFDAQGRIIGDPQSLSRLVSLGRLSFLWYGVGGFIVALGLGISGYFFLASQANPGVIWVGPWILLCALTGINFWFAPIWAMLQGCNKVAEINAFNWHVGIYVSLATWAAIIFQASLWTSSVFYLVNIIGGILFLYHKYPKFLQNFLQIPAVGIDWKQDVLPMQWRIAVSWLVGGYLTYSLFTPIAFHYHGPVVAGKVGMSMNIITVVASIVGLWGEVKAPRFGILISKKLYGQLDKELYKILSITVLIACVSGIALWVGVLLLNKYQPIYAQRLMPPLAMGIFIMARMIHTSSTPLSIYLRAHKKEPLLLFSVIFGVLVGLSTLIMGKLYASIGMAVGYLIVSIIMTPYLIQIWLRCRKQWHQG